MLYVLFAKNKIYQKGHQEKGQISDIIKSLDRHETIFMFEKVDTSK